MQIASWIAYVLAQGREKFNGTRRLAERQYSETLLAADLQHHLLREMEKYSDQELTELFGLLPVGLTIFREQIWSLGKAIRVAELLDFQVSLTLRKEGRTLNCEVQT